MTGASVRRLLSRSCFGAAGIAFVAAVVPLGASAQTAAPRPKVFSTATNAVGVDYVPDQQGGLTPIKDTLHMQFVTGLSSMSSSNGPAAQGHGRRPRQRHHPRAAHRLRRVRRRSP